MKHSSIKATLIFGFVGIFFPQLPALALNQSDADELAQSLLKQSLRHCAMIALPHCGSGELAVGFWNRGGGNAKGGDSRLLIDAFESDPAALAAAQAKAGLLGLTGRNMYVRSGALSTKDYSMPYADHFCDLVAITNLADADLNNVSYSEVERVLCMGAKAWVGRSSAEGKGALSAAALTKWIAGTHELSSATVVNDATGTWAVITMNDQLPDTYNGPIRDTFNGSNFYNDKKATWPCLPQWYVKPYANIMSESAKVHDLKFLAIAAGGGRIYGHYDLDGARKFLDGIVALRAYNGQILWNRSDLTGRVLPCSKGIVCGNRIIDGETANPALDKTIPIPADARVAWDGVENDIYYAVVKTGGKATLVAHDLMANKTLYNIADFCSNGPGTMLMAGGKLYSCSSIAAYCYKLSDGSKLWGPVKMPVAASGFKASSNGLLFRAAPPSTAKQQPKSAPGDWKALFLIQRSTLADLYFLSAKDGSLQWGPVQLKWKYDVGQNDHFNNGREFVVAEYGDGTVLDLLSGKPLPQKVPFGLAAACGNGSMTSAGTYGQGNGIQYSFEKGEKTAVGANSYVTPCALNAGPFATAGMTIYENKGCPCYGVFMGLKSEAPRGSFDSEQPAVESERLEKGPAYDNLSAKVLPDALDWPTHRANNSRSAATAAKVATNECIQIWNYTNPTPNVYKAPTPDDYTYTYQDVTPPVTAGGYAYVAGSDGVLKCFETATGKNVWNYTTGGWIFATPTIANGCVYVGSGDGYAYCIEAHTGRLVWRFRAAPAERRFNYFGHLISTWPILTGVLVQNGVAYFESGIRDEYGVQAYALDARTGSLAKGWQNMRVGVHWVDKPGLGRIGHIPGGYMTVMDSNLYVKEPYRTNWTGPGGQSQRMGIFDLKTGVMPSEDNTWNPGKFSIEGCGFDWNNWTGRQIGSIGNYVIGWGEDFHSEMQFRGKFPGAVSFAKISKSDGNPVPPFPHISAKTYLGAKGFMNCVAWDDSNLYMDGQKYALSKWIEALERAVQSGTNSFAQPGSIAQWKGSANTGINRAMALTADCVVQANADGDIFVMDRMTGAQLFKVSTGGEPYAQALAVDRNGRIIVVNRNGDVVCFGSTKN